MNIPLNPRYFIALAFSPWEIPWEIPWFSCRCSLQPTGTSRRLLFQLQLRDFFVRLSQGFLKGLRPWMGVFDHWHGGFQKWGYPKNGCFSSWKIHGNPNLKWMMTGGYLHFRKKPPYRCDIDIDHAQRCQVLRL